MLAVYGLEDCNTTKLPGTKVENRKNEEVPIVDPVQRAAYRTAVGKGLFYGHRRADVQYNIKESARTVSGPSEPDEQRLRRIFRYLHGTRDLCQFLEPRGVQEEYRIKTFVDSDWAGDRVSRKSTSGGAVLVNQAMVLSYSRTQQTIAQSAAEAELNALTSGVSESLGIKAFLEEIGRKATVEVCSDSSSAISIASRLGQGRLKHLEIRQLKIQEYVRRKMIYLTKVDTAHNYSDILTKSLPLKPFEYHRRNLGFRMEAEVNMVSIKKEAREAPSGWTTMSSGFRTCLSGLLVLLRAEGAEGACPSESSPVDFYIFTFMLLASVFIAGVFVGFVYARSVDRKEVIRGIAPREVEEETSGEELDSDEETRQLRRRRREPEVWLNEDTPDNEWVILKKSRVLEVMKKSRLSDLRDMAVEVGHEGDYPRSILEEKVLKSYTWASGAQLGYAFVVSKQLDKPVPIKQMKNTHVASIWLARSESKLVRMKNARARGTRGQG